jgi:hypothetical protein
MCPLTATVRTAWPFGTLQRSPDRSEVFNKMNTEWRITWQGIEKFPLWN